MMILFWLIAFVTIFSALCVVMQKNPMASALSLVVSMLSMALLFMMLHSYMLAALQVIVYAGAVMVLFLFVIMLLNLRRDEERLSAAYVTVTSVLTIVAFAALYAALGSLDRSHTLLGSARQGGLEIDQVGGSISVKFLAEKMFADYAYPFELTGVLLLVAMVGVVVLARRRAPS